MESSSEDSYKSAEVTVLDAIDACGAGQPVWHLHSFHLLINTGCIERLCVKAIYQAESNDNKTFSCWCHITTRREEGGSVLIVLSSQSIWSFFLCISSSTLVRQTVNLSKKVGGLSFQCLVSPTRLTFRMKFPKDMLLVQK